MMAPPKGCATHNGKKLQFLFIFCSFLAKLEPQAQALKKFGRPLQHFLFGIAAIKEVT
jgi:hypothetical protein